MKVKLNLKNGCHQGYLESRWDVEPKLVLPFPWLTFVGTDKIVNFNKSVEKLDEIRPSNSKMKFLALICNVYRAW